MEGGGGPAQEARAPMDPGLLPAALGTQVGSLLAAFYRIQLVQCRWFAAYIRTGRDHRSDFQVSISFASIRAIVSRP